MVVAEVVVREGVEFGVVEAVVEIVGVVEVVEVVQCQWVVAEVEVVEEILLL